MNTPSAARRSVDLSFLDEHVKKLKPREAIPRDDSRKKNVSIAKGNLVPVIQADVGREESVDVYRYRLLLPVAQIISRTADDVRRIVVAHEDGRHSSETFKR